VRARSPTVALTREQAARIDEAKRLASSGGAGVAALISMLDEPSWTVRREVVAALAGLGAAATAPLVTVLLSQRDSEARIAAAVDALSSIATEFASLAQLSRSADPAVLADFAQILGRRRSVSQVPELVQLVAHADDNVSVAAIEALGRIGGSGGIDALIGAAESGNFFRMFPAIDVLGRSGDPRAVAPLARLLANPTYTLEAARALGRTGEPAAVAPLVLLLSRASESAVRVAAVALAELHASNVERYGATDAVEHALQRANPGPATERRLIASLNKADTAERRAIAFVLGALGSQEGASALLPLLDENTVAGSAASALKRMGKDAEPLLLETLRSGNSARRLAILPTLTSSSSAPDVVACLSDPDSEVRAIACGVLSRLGTARVVAALFERLDDTNPRVVQAAIGAIQSLGSAETGQLALASAESTSQSRRWGGLRILAYFGDAAALPVFLRALDTDDARGRDIALAGLALVELPAALDALLAAARSATEKTRATAMRALGQCTQSDARIGAALRAALADSDAWVRYYACQALGRRGEDAATDAIVGLLADSAGHVRVAAVEALAHFKTEAARRALREAAEGSDIDIQRAALLGLGSQKDPELMPILTRAAESSDAATRLVALSALANSAAPGTLPSLARAARDVDENVRTAAQGFLAAFGTEAASSELVELLRAGIDTPRVVKLLASNGRGHVPAIAQALASADEELARHLSAVLARLRNVEAAAALISAMALTSATARKAAASALASLRTAEAWEVLRRAADSDPDPEVRNVAAVLVAT
jgi:HEAT repeat protein